MSEICIATDPKLSPAEQAVSHVLKRFAEDRDFSWHMAGTETLAKCVRAEAHRLGVEQQAVIERVNTEYAAAQDRLDNSGRGEAQLVVARRRISELEAALDGSGGGLVAKDLLRYEAQKERAAELKQKAVAFFDDLHFGEKTLPEELYRRMIEFAESWD